jgi:hypothetical protein
MLRLTAFLLLVFTIPIPSFAWGPQGHRVVAEVAQHHLTPQARDSIRLLLGNQDLASFSTWADEIRSQRPQTFGWHFVDIPWNALGFSQSRDCSRQEGQSHQPEPDSHDCVVDRIVVFQRILSDSQAPTSARAEALKFLVHLVADVHQPMHAIGEARGGNDIRVVEFGHSSCGSRPCNLHSVWDLGLIHHRRWSDEEYVAGLEQIIAQAGLETKPLGTPEDWADESFHLAHTVWLTDGSFVDESYYRRSIRLLDQQLALAGIRLARLLNHALAH